MWKLLMKKTRCSTSTPTVLRKDGPIASSLQNMGLGVIKSLPRKTSAYLCTIFLPIQSTGAKTAHSRERKSANYRKAESLGVWTCLTRLFLIPFFLSLWSSWVIMRRKTTGKASCERNED